MGNVICLGHWKGTENSICMVAGNEQDIVPYPLQNGYRKFRDFLKKEISSVPGNLIFLVHFLLKFHIWKCRFCCSVIEFCCFFCIFKKILRWLPLHWIFYVFLQ